MAAGHRDPGSYTLAQLTAYLAADSRAERRRQRDLLYLLRVAQADKDGFREAWKELAKQ
jgi:hypothetical protein